VIALLHYAVLKSVRDKSLPVLLAAPSLIIAAMVLGTSFAKGVHYPFQIERQWTAAQNARLAGMIAMLAAVLFTSTAAFWTLRAEVATKAIGSFVLAARAVVVAASATAYAAVAGLASWLLSVVTVAALTGAWPFDGAMAIEIVLAIGTAAAIGVLAASVSPQPQVLIWAYCGTLLILSPLHDSHAMFAAPAVMIVCIGAAAFLLERRCAA
jgi:hypothetical protein